MNTLTHRIMAAIPDAHERWPEWFKAVHMCPFGHRIVSTSVSDKGGLHRCDGHCGFNHFDNEIHPTGEIVHIGPDLTDERNLWALFDVADAVNKSGPVEVTRSGINCVHTFHARMIVEGEYGRLILHEGQGPTRTDALINALCAALGVERNPDVQARVDAAGAK